MKGSVFPHAAAGLSICGNASDHSAMQGAARPNPKILPLPLSAPEASAPPRAAKHTPNPHSVPKTQVSSTGKGAETALNHRGDPESPGPVEPRAPFGSRQPLQFRAAAAHGQGAGSRPLQTPGKAGALRPWMATDTQGATHHHLASGFRGPNLACSRPRNRPPKPTMLRAGGVLRTFWLEGGPGEEGDGPLPPLYG